MRRHRPVLALVALLAGGTAALVLPEPAAGRDLVLEVTLNGRETGVVAQLVERKGALFGTEAELAGIGLRLPPEILEGRDEEGLIPLAALRGVRATVEERSQRLLLDAPVAALRPAVLAAEGDIRLGGPAGTAGAAFGATLNYDLLAATGGGQDAVSGAYEARLFDGFGVITTSGLAFGEQPIAGQDRFVRLETSWTYAEPDELRRWRGGDLIGTGPAWARPVRMAGGQVSSDFGLRPDLVTFPLPVISGQSAVASTVDVLVNGVRRLSDRVPAGPFELRQLPVVTGAGELTIAVRDALGRETITTLPFYASSSLLAEGLSAYGVQAGVVRRNFGFLSNDYGMAVASGGVRHGVTDWLTLEGYAEVGEGLAMGGIGAAALVGNLGVLSLAAAASSGPGAQGTMIQAGFERVAGPFSIGGTATIASEDFADIASVTGTPVPRRAFRIGGGLSLGRYGAVGLGYVEQAGGGAVSTAFGRFRVADVSLATASYSLPLADGVFAYASAFRSFEGERPWGVVFGLSFSLGRNTNVGGQTMVNSGVASAGVQASRGALNAGETGYRVLAQQGRGEGRRAAEIDHVTSWGRVTAGVDQAGERTGGRLALRGALTAVDGGIFASHPIQDSFAVVRTEGIPGVGVFHDNRRVGETDSSGRLLVPNLRAWEPNRLSLDPWTLPLDADPRSTRMEVRPQERSAVVAEFRVRAGGAALLRLRDTAGEPLPVGSMARLAGSDQRAPVGHDGEAFFTGLGERNRVEVSVAGNGSCAVTFEFRPVAGDIPTVGPLECR